MEEKKITPDELPAYMEEQRVKNGGVMPLIRIRGGLVVRDKDGNIKGRMKFFSEDEDK